MKSRAPHPFAATLLAIATLPALPAVAGAAQCDGTVTLSDPAASCTVCSDEVDLSRAVILSSVSEYPGGECPEPWGSSAGELAFTSEFESCPHRRYRVTGSVAGVDLEVVVVGAANADEAIEAVLGHCALDPALAQQLDATVGAEQTLSTSDCTALAITTAPPEGAVVIGDPADFNNIIVVCGIVTVTTTQRSDTLSEIPVTLREAAPVPAMGLRPFAMLGLLLVGLGVRALRR